MAVVIEVSPSFCCFSSLCLCFGMPDLYKIVEVV